MLRRVREDIRLGWYAPARDMLAGAALALPVSALLALLLGAANVESPALVLVVGAFQLLLGYAIAGRLAERRR
jgi:hypothetical protein